MEAASISKCINQKTFFIFTFQNKQTWLKHADITALKNKAGEKKKTKTAAAF